jgi:hypothetical protein
MCLQCILDSPLSIILLQSPLLPFLEQFQQASFFLFIHDYTLYLPYLPSFTLSWCSTSSHWYPQLDRICFTSCSSFFKFILILQGKTINSLQYIPLYYLHTQIQCFSIFHSLTFSFPLLPPCSTLRQTRPTNTIMFVLSLSLSHVLCKYLCIYI